MNYYEARRVDPDANRPDAGKWRYTCMNDGRIWPIGYCAQDCPGHDDPEGAEQHQREFDLEEALRRGPSHSEPWSFCKFPGCGRRTPSFFEVGPGMGRPIYLCEQHQGREGLATIYRGPGRVISSY